MGKKLKIKFLAYVNKHMIVDFLNDLKNTISQFEPSIYISNFINEQDKQNLTTTELRTPSILCQYISKPIISFLPINPYYFYLM